MRMAALLITAPLLAGCFQTPLVGVGGNVSLCVLCSVKDGGEINTSKPKKPSVAGEIGGKIFSSIIGAKK